LSRMSYIVYFFGLQDLTAVAMKSSYLRGHSTIWSGGSLRRFGGAFRIHIQGRSVSEARNQHEAGRKYSVSVSCYSLSLNMDVKCSSETSVDIQRTTRRYIPEDNFMALITFTVCLH
jgi:hypothetical protein